MLSPMSVLPASVVSILELFKGPLASVRFADVDAEGLATLAADVERAALEVGDQEAKLAELRQNLSQAQESLLVLAQRAHAYARVYAETNDELLEALDQISLPRPPKPRKQAAPKSSSTVPAAALEQSAIVPNEAASLASSSGGLESEAALELEPARAVELDAESREVASVTASGRKGKKGPLRAAREANAAGEN